MTYKDVVDRIKEITFDHKMLVDFGYGQLSDIKTRAEGSDGDVNDADYPYLFLNPAAHVRTQTQITYNFNMVVMDMAREEEGDPYQNFLAIQSDCIQYIDDVIARLYFHYTDQPEVSFDLSYTPFYERFQDDLAGATANLSITVPTNINDCITPFGPVVICPQTLTQFAAATNNFTYTYSTTGSRFWRWETNTQTDTSIASWSDISLSVIQGGEYEFTIEQELSFTEPVGAEVLPPRPVFSGSNPVIELQPVCDSGNWPTTWTSSDPINYKATYRATLNDNTANYLITFNTSGPASSEVVASVGGTLKIGYKA